MQLLKIALPILFYSSLSFGHSPQVELGHQLFFDPRLSFTQTVSCHSCHRVVEASDGKASGTDGLRVSKGIQGLEGNRNAPTVLNSGKRGVLFWDGRASSLEEQAKGPLTNPVEMAMKSHDVVVEVLEKIPEYRKAFATVYQKERGSGASKITLHEVVSAIAAFERTLDAEDSPFDRFRRGDSGALDEKAKRGWEKFQSVACIACHGAPTFAGKEYFVRFPTRSAAEYDAQFGLTKDAGRYGVTREGKDMNVWRIPSLRNVALTAPYFHNGSVDTLEQAVRVMAKAQLSKTLSDEDVSDIVAFLKSLTGKLTPVSVPQLPGDKTNRLLDRSGFPRADSKKK